MVERFRDEWKQSGIFVGEEVDLSAIADDAVVARVTEAMRQAARAL